MRRVVHPLDYCRKNESSIYEWSSEQLKLSKQSVLYELLHMKHYQEYIKQEKKITN
jgi:hypothetical protein